MRRLALGALALCTGCWTTASYEPLRHQTRAARRPEDVAVLDCAPDAGVLVLGRLTAIKSSVMPILRQDIPFNDPDAQQAMRAEAAKNGCDAIIGVPTNETPAPCGEPSGKPLVGALGVAFVDGGG